MTSPNRHQDDELREEIKKMILDEPDPRERAKLMVMLSLNNVLIDNVVAVRELTEEFKGHRKEFNTHQQDFQEHVQQEMRAITYGKGAIWGVIAMLGIVQFLAGYIYSQHMTEFREVASMANDTYQAVKVHAEHHKGEEKKFDEMLVEIRKSRKP